MLRVAPLLVLLAFLVPPASAQAEVELLWKLQPGQKFQIDISQKMNQKLNVADQRINVQMTMEIFSTWEVAQVTEAGEIHLVETMDRVVMAMQLPNGIESKWDSQAGGEPTGPASEVAKSLKPLLGVKITRVMSPRGKVLDLKIPAGALDGTPLKGMFEKNGLGNVIQNASPTFPAGKIAAGKQWDSEFEAKLPVGAMKAKADYTYQGQEAHNGRPQAKIDLDLKMDLDINAPGQQVKLADQNTEGTIWFDAQAGRITESKVDQQFTLEVSGGGMKMMMDIEMEQKMLLTPAN